MSEALTGRSEKRSPAVRASRAKDLVDANGRPIMPDPAGTITEGAEYTPDETAYLIDPMDSPVAQFFADVQDEKKTVTVEAYLRDDVELELSEGEVLAAAAGGTFGKILETFRERRHHALRERARAEAIADHRALVEADAAARGETLREDWTDDYEPGDVNNLGTGQSPPNQDEILPLGNGPYNQQLYLYDRWSMLAKSFYASTHDPVANAGLQIIVDFVLGRGFRVVFEDPECQDEWDEFWKQNRGDERVAQWLYDWFCAGENYTRFFPQGDRPPRIAMLEPSTIVEIVTDPENLDNVWYYVQQYTSQWQQYAKSGVDSIKYVFREIAPTYVLHSKINASSTEKHGRSDLFPVLGWLKRLRDYYNAETMKAIVQAAFAWDFTLKGSQADVNTVSGYAQQNPPPNLAAPGQAFYHNEAVELKPLQADKAATSTGSIGIGDGLLGIIAVGLHIAKDYLGVTSRGARATAVVAETPAVKHFEGRQRTVRHWITRMADMVIDIAILEGRLEKQAFKKADRKTTKMAVAALRKGNVKAALILIAALVRGGEVGPRDRKVEVIFPDIVKADRAQTIEDVERAESDGYISKRRAAGIVAGAFDIQDYDFDDEQDDIAEEGPQMISKTGQQVRKGPPLASDAAFDPGEVPNPAAEPHADPAGTPSGTRPASKPTPPDNPAGAGQRSIRIGNTGARAREGAVGSAVRKSISFLIRR